PLLTPPSLHDALPISLAFADAARPVVRGGPARHRGNARGAEDAARDVARAGRGAGCLRRARRGRNRADCSAGRSVRLDPRPPLLEALPILRRTCTSTTTSITMTTSLAASRR